MDSCDSATPMSVDNIAPWFSYYKSIKSVVINEGVTSIGDAAFCYCSYITSISIPSTVTTIGNNAFLSTKITSITIPDGVTSLPRLFQNCSKLKTVVLPATITSIADYCFNGTALTDVYFCGTEAQWKAISVKYYTAGHYGDSSYDINAKLLSATIHYNYLVPCTTHTWNTGSLTTKMTDTQDGLVTYTCTRCGETKGVTLPAGGSPFVDVQDSSQYYYKPVLWGADNGIVYGTSDFEFSPSATCTRAQVVTFLYRYKS